MKFAWGPNRLPHGCGSEIPFADTVLALRARTNLACLDKLKQN
jgi:hypothetical protein